MSLIKQSYYLLFVLLLGSSYNSYGEDHQKIRVGVVLALSGPVSISGIPFKNAMTLAKEHYDKQDQLEIVYEDDEFIPRKTLTAVQKLLQSKIDALVVFGTNQGLAVVDIAEQRKIPFISLNVNRSVVRGRKHTVLLMPSVEDLTAAQVSEAKKRGYKRVATVASQQDSCLLQQDIFENSGVVKIVSSQEFQPSEREFREIASRIIHSKPDAVFISTLPPQGSLIAKRLRQLGFKGEMFGGIQIAHLSELRASAGALVGGWVVSGDGRPAGDFHKKYRERFEEEPSHFAMYAYDSVRLILEGSKTGDLNNYLHRVNNFDGIVGTYSADGRNGFNFKVAALQFTEDDFVYLDPQ